MKWIGISGGRRKINKEIERKVRNTVQKIMLRGDGIVSSGAPGVDFIALDEALKYNPNASRIKIFLPVSLKIYVGHCRKQVREKAPTAETITSQEAESLISQLVKLRKTAPRSLIESKRKIVNKATYHERNSAVVKASDKLIAFHIKSKLSRGAGTQDTIDKAKQKGIPVKIFSFDLTKS